MKKISKLPLIGLMFLFCTAVWVKITKARLYDAPSHLTMFKASDSGNSY